MQLVQLRTLRTTTKWPIRTVGATLEIFPACKRKKFPRTQEKNNHHPTKPKSPISAFDDDVGYWRPGQYYAMLHLLAPGFSDVVAHWHGSCVPVCCLIWESGLPGHKKWPPHQFYSVTTTKLLSPSASWPSGLDASETRPHLGLFLHIRP